MESSSASAPDDARPAPEKWKAQRVFRERQRARLQSSEAQIQQLHVSLAAVEQEKAHLRAQVQTLSQLLSRGTDQRSGNADADWRVSDLQQQLHELSRLLQASELARRDLERQGTEAQARVQAVDARNAELQRAVQDMTGRLDAAMDVIRRHTENAAPDQQPRPVPAQACQAPAGGPPLPECQRQKQELQQTATSKAPLTVSRPQTPGSGHSSSDQQAQKLIDLDDDAASAMAALLLLMRGPGAAGTTAQECRRIAPRAYYHAQHEAIQQFRALLELGAEVEGSPAAARMQQLFDTYLGVPQRLWHRAVPLLHGMGVCMVCKIGEPPPDVNARVLAAMALREEQMDEACDEYGRLLASLKRLTAEQGAVLSAWPQQPGAVFITTQAVEFQRIGLHMLGALRDFHLAWPERILRPVQYVRGIVTASPWIVNTVAISRELAVRRDRVPDSASGMADVLQWLFNDGSSSAVAAEPDNMSVASLQDALQHIDDDVGYNMSPDDPDTGRGQQAVPL